MAVAAVTVSILLASFSAWHRRPWSDEGWFSSPAYNLAHEGFFGTTVFEPSGAGKLRIDQVTYWVQPLFLLGQAAWYTGMPADVFSTRLFTIVWVPIVAFALFSLVSSLTKNATVAGLSVLILAMDYQFIYNSGFARPEIMCLALGLGALAAYERLRIENLTNALAASGALVTLSCLTHPNGILHAIGLSILVLMRDRARLTIGAVTMGALPALALSACWLGYIAYDPEAFREQLLGNSYGRVAASYNPLTLFWNEISERYFVAFGVWSESPLIKLKSLPLVAYFSAILLLGTAAYRTSQANRILLAWFAGYFLTQMVFNQKLSYYLVHILPIYAVSLAVVVERLWRSSERIGRIAIVSSLAALACLQGAGIIHRSSSQSYRAEMASTASYLASHAAEANTIVGSASLLYDLDFDPRLIDEPDLAVDGPEPDVIIVEELYDTLYGFWQRERPATYKTIMETLQAYELAHQTDNYRIYFHPQFTEARQSE